MLITPPDWHLERTRTIILVFFISFSGKVSINLAVYDTRTATGFLRQLYDGQRSEVGSFKGPPVVDGGFNHNDTSIIRCNHHNTKSKQKKDKKYDKTRQAKVWESYMPWYAKMAKAADAPCLSGSRQDGIKERFDASSYR